MTPEERGKLWPMLFWGPKLRNHNAKGDLIDATGALVELFFSVVTGKVLNFQPKDCVNTKIARADREALARALAGGEVLEEYVGYADCRICGVKLGNQDLMGWGFMWPERAEHYILEHEVWTPDCVRLLAAIRTT
jgi:hypothetical protein